MKRGDVVVVATAGDYGKPRPAIVVQTDTFAETHASIIICQMTSQLVDAPDFRIAIQPTPENGLREISQVMVDKPVTVRRERVSATIGHLTPAQMSRVNTAIALVMGLAD